MAVLTVGVLKETFPGERRVALVPEQVSRLIGKGMRVLVEAGAGARAFCPDAAYQAAGAEVRPGSVVLAAAKLLLVVRPPAEELLPLLRDGQILVGMLSPLTEPRLMADLASRGVTAISLDQLPRTLSRAQSMDPLTSQANIAGYKAVVVAADAYPGYFPMLMTAAGTVRPAEILVLGAGVAGLQAIGTARRLGGVVRGYDVRPEARGEIESLGARYLDVGPPLGGGAGGYARELTAEESAAQRSALEQAIAVQDVVITTAQVPGRRPPVLLSAAALAGMHAGSVVVDLAAGPLGGNVEGSQPDTTVVTRGGVTVIGAGNLPSQVPRAASDAYSRNITAFVESVCPEGIPVFTPDDEIQQAVVITRDHRVVQQCTAATVARLVEGEQQHDPVLVH